MTTDFYRAIGGRARDRRRRVRSVGRERSGPWIGGATPVHRQAHPRPDAHRSRGRGGGPRNRIGVGPPGPRGAPGPGRGYGLDGSPHTLRNAAGYTGVPTIGYVAGDFDAIPFADRTVDHVFSMDAFYSVPEPVHTVEEVARVLRPGGTCYCAMNSSTESEHTHRWPEDISIDMTRWSRSEYRDAFRSGDLYVAEQDPVPDRGDRHPTGRRVPHGRLGEPRGDARSVPDLGDAPHRRGRARGRLALEAGR